MSYPLMVHFSQTPRLRIRSVEQFDRPYFKPNGLWVSDESGDEGWSTWCRESEFPIGRYPFTVKLADDANVLVLRTEQAVNSFTSEFTDTHEMLFSRITFNHFIDWGMVAKKYQGLIITPYQWQLRLEPATFWYNPWDCASGCIWDACAVQSVRPNWK